MNSSDGSFQCFPLGVVGAVPFSSVSMHAMRFSVHTLHSIQYSIQYADHYTSTSYDILTRKTMKKMLMRKLESWSIIIHESFARQNGNYKLTCQWENTISSVFTLLQSNNTQQFRTVTNFENWRGGGGQKGFVVGALPPSGYCPAAIHCWN